MCIGRRIAGRLDDEVKASVYELAGNKINDGINFIRVASDILYITDELDEEEVAAIKILISRGIKIINMVVDDIKPLIPNDQKYDKDATKSDDVKANDILTEIKSFLDAVKNVKWNDDLKKKIDILRANRTNMDTYKSTQLYPLKDDFPKD